MRYHKRLIGITLSGLFVLGLPSSGFTMPKELVPPPRAVLTNQYLALTDTGKLETTQSESIAEEKVDLARLVRDGVRRPKIGLALGGGGTRGAAHVGVLRVLEKEGIPVDCVAGTSIGAIVGGLYCAGVKLDDIENMVARKTLMKAYYTVPIWFRVALVPVFLVPHALGHHHYDGLYRGNKFASFVNKSAGVDNHQIEKFRIPFCAVAASLMDGNAHAIKSGDLGKALQASSAIPVLRRPVEIENNLYVDGGIINNLPVEQVRAMGADIVIAVDVDERLNDNDLNEFKKIGSVYNRVVSMILSRVDRDQVTSADVLIRPDVNGIRLLSTKESDAYRAIEAGEKATKEMMSQLRQEILARSSDLPDEVERSGAAK
ncbi:MAG: patatin-like phospholipase family protein [Candidatus Obscuribacterales bacterium]|nr:patatin-like phospholipase family protein [Candidatus Obscuribacterales bacterium]